MLAPLELAAKSGKPWLLLLTKSDLGGGAGIVPDKDWRTPEAIISLSRAPPEGFDALEAAIHSGRTPDVVLTEGEQAENARGELTGRTAREDMVARIFERFCVGK